MKYRVISIEFGDGDDDGQVVFTLQREAVLPDDYLIRKLEIFGVPVETLPGGFLDLMDVAVERIAENYERGLKQLEVAQEEEEENDEGGIELR